MLACLLLCSLPLAIPVVGSALASVLPVVALASPANVAPLGTVADYGTFDPIPGEVEILRAYLRLSSEAAPPRGADGRFVKGSRTLPARGSSGRFVSRATLAGLTAPSVY